MKKKSLLMLALIVIFACSLTVGLSGCNNFGKIESNVLGVLSSKNTSDLSSTSADILPVNSKSVGYSNMATTSSNMDVPITHEHTFNKHYS